MNRFLKMLEAGTYREHREGDLLCRLPLHNTEIFVGSV